jgi:hypothetical protein
MVELYLHSVIRVYGVVLNLLNTGKFYLLKGFLKFFKDNRVGAGEGKGGGMITVSVMFQNTVSLTTIAAVTSIIRKKSCLQLNFPTFYVTRRFITVFKRALHWSLS